MEKAMKTKLPDLQETQAADGLQKKRGFRSFYTKGEEIFNAVSHIVGGAFGLVVLIIGLVYGYPSAVDMAAMSVFALSIIVLYTMSALYHFLPSGRAKGVFRIFDHCTIYLSLIHI